MSECLDEAVTVERHVRAHDVVTRTFRSLPDRPGMTVGSWFPWLTWNRCRVSPGGRVSQVDRVKQGVTKAFGAESVVVHVPDKIVATSARGHAD